MLWPRLLTAIVGLPVLVACIYFGNLPFFFLILGVVLMGLREFYLLAAESGYPSYPWLGIVAGALLVLSVFLNGTALGQATDNQGTAALLALFLVALILRSLWQGPSETI